MTLCWASREQAAARSEVVVIRSMNYPWRFRQAFCRKRWYVKGVAEDLSSSFEPEHGFFVSFGGAEWCSWWFRDQRECRDAAPPVSRDQRWLWITPLRKLSGLARVPLPVAGEIHRLATLHRGDHAVGDTVDKDVTRTERAATVDGPAELQARWDRAQSTPFLWIRRQRRPRQFSPLNR